MSSNIKVWVLVVGLTLTALAGFGLVSKQVQNVVRTAASAVWGA